MASRKLQTSNHTEQNMTNWCYSTLYVSLYLLEHSAADEDSNMVSLVFPTGREGLQEHKHNMYQTHIINSINTE